MAYTQSQLDVLTAAIASGVLRVTFADRTIEYRSLADIRAAAQQIQAVLAAQAGTPNSRQVRMHCSKGLGPSVITGFDILND